MYFKRKENLLEISLTEAVRLAYARYASPRDPDAAPASLSLVYDVDERALRKDSVPTQMGDACLFEKILPLEDIRVRLMGYAVPAYREDGEIMSLTLFAETDEDPETPSASLLKHIRGIAFLLAALADTDGITLKLSLSSLPFDKTVCRVEKPAKKDVLRFLSRLLSALKEDAHAELDRVTRRLPSFLSVAFPYTEVREGQKDMMRAVLSAAKHGETLFAMAPTGTGKTMAVLFPALRALGAREVDKVFYLTPKNTSAIAALDAAVLLREKGAQLRAVHLGAKERLCARRRTTESCYGCPLGHSKEREYAAVRALLEEDPAAVREEDIIRTATRFGVCPHELSLSYSAYADVIVCDYNYLFDPRVFLARYFSRAGEYLFLVDEAHNLPDRAREMYSAGVKDDFFDTLSSLFGDSVRLSEIARRFQEVFIKTVDALIGAELRVDADGTATGFAYTSTLPSAFLSALYKCTDVFEREVRKKRGEESEEDKQLRKCVYALKELCLKIGLYDEHFVTYALREGDSRTLRFFCNDPSRLIGERLDKGKAAVFFSATLSPLDYYRAVLCGSRPTVKIDVPSPFDSGALCVGVVGSVSVRAAERENSLAEIAKLIVSAMRAKRGNYMVFCPSFDYLERIAEAFHRLTPQTPIAVQKRHMSQKEREAFLSSFSEDNQGYFVGFCVTGGIYAEGVDLVGNRLIGTIIVGLGLPQVSAEREMIAAHYEDITEEGKLYAYFYPALNRIMQAAGRVIRTESDRGIVVLIDDRLRDPFCRKMFPPSWRHLKYLPDRNALSAYIARFWENVDEEREQR